MTTSLEPETARLSRGDNHPSDRFRAALFGAVSVGLSFGISELIAGAIGAPSLIQGVADWVVDSAPPSVKDWAISTFGTNDKPALLIGIVVVGLVLGGVVGVLSKRRIEPALVAFGAFGILAAVATASNPAAGTTGPWLIAIVSVMAGLGAFRWLLNRTQASGAHPIGEPDQSRRSFLLASSVGGFALLTAGVGRALFSSNRASASQQSSVTVNPGTSDIPAAAPPDPGSLPSFR